jgi:hypothetical protein
MLQEIVVSINSIDEHTTILLFPLQGIQGIYTQPLYFYIFPKYKGNLSLARNASGT